MGERDGLFSFAGRFPSLGRNAFAAPTAVLIGDVRLEEYSSVWFGCVIRADDGLIKIGAQTNVQDGAILHADAENAITIGNSVTIGHGAIIHACTVEDGAMIGIGATVLDGATVGRGAVVAAGGLVPPGRTVASGMLVRGVPAREIGSVSPELRAHILEIVEAYKELAQQYSRETRVCPRCRPRYKGS
jgi:carbonic anhydrase/acetyltransferase-like protein (isoleucine patch superfamily)